MLESPDLEEKGEDIRDSTPVEKDLRDDEKDESNVTVTSVRKVLLRLLSSGSDDQENRGGVVQREPSARSVIRRSNTFTLSNMSAAEVTTLMQDTIYKESFMEKLKSKVPMPLVLW